MSWSASKDTPGKLLPKPIPAAFNSAGILQKKTKWFNDKMLASAETPETPLKSERSKFLAPLNLTPFALSPKVLGAKAHSAPKLTTLNRENGLDSPTHSFGGFSESCLLGSPSNYSSMLSMMDTDCVNETMEDICSDMVAEDFQDFTEDDEPNACNFEIQTTDIYSRSQSVAGEGDSYDIDCAALSYVEPWKSPFLRFLTDEPSLKSTDFPQNYFDPALDYFSSAFEIMEILGHGSFSVVYRVCPKGSRDMLGFALKKTKTPFSGHADRSAKIREVEILWKVRDCFNCVRIENAWEQYGSMYILMEFCAGGSLKTLIDRYVDNDERFSEDSIWSILLQCCTALEFLHSHEIIHLDLKPENIFIDSGGSLKLGDFGLASAPGVPPRLHSEGDKYYMAPEILEGIYGKSADVFSLGLILLELAANVQLPPNGTSWQNLRHGDFSELSFDDTSDLLTQLIKDMTCPEPESRPTIEKVKRRAVFAQERNRIKTARAI